MPLNRNKKRMLRQTECFDQTIVGMGLDMKWTGKLFHTLGMHRVDHDCFVGSNPVSEMATLGQGYGVAVTITALKYLGIWCLVIVVLADLSHLGIQTAAHGYVHLLESPANSQDRLVQTRTASDQLESHLIPTGIWQRLMMIGAIVVGFDIRQATWQQDAIQ